MPATKIRRDAWQRILDHLLSLDFRPRGAAAYAKLAGPALTSNGGRFLARGGTAKTYEQGIAERTVLIEFESVEKAIAATTPAYREALAALGHACERDMRIVEGVE